MSDWFWGDRYKILSRWWREGGFWMCTTRSSSRTWRSPRIWWRSYKIPEVKWNQTRTLVKVILCPLNNSATITLSYRRELLPYNDKNHKFTRIAATMRKILAYVQTNLYTLSSDKEICKKWILKLRQLKATDVTVKKNRNSFFKYFLQVLHRAVQGEDVLGASPLDAKVN